MYVMLSLITLQFLGQKYIFIIKDVHLQAGNNYFLKLNYLLISILV